LDVLDRLVIGLNNLSVKGRRVRVKPEQILVLFPSCLQASGCEQNVVGDVANCKRCGRCKIGSMLELCERTGAQGAIAKGGRAAVERARQPDIKAIVAVACEKELKSGIFACLPKAVIAVANRRPNGPCNWTDVDIEDVEAAIQWLTRGPR
jgi:uncharacterized protein